MTVTAFRRISVYALVCAVSACGGSDSTGPGNQQASVQLTSSTEHMTAPGNVDFVATVSGAPPTTSRTVKFYETTVGSNVPPQEVGIDSVVPFTYSRPFSSEVDNGTKEYTAKVYNGTTEIGSSNAVRVTVNLPELPLAANFMYSGPRVSQAGNIWFRAAANKPLARVEVYNGSTKVAELAKVADTVDIPVAVTVADNGTQSYVVQAYDAGGAVVMSNPIPVTVDIRWTMIQNIGAFHANGEMFIATDASGAIYYAGATDSHDLFLAKYDPDGHEQWSRTFGGPDNEYASSVTLDATGHVYLGGTVFAQGQINVSQCFVNVYDANGGLLVTRQIKPPTADRTSDCFVAIDASNNLYMIGYASNTTRSWLFVQKYDANGNVLWNNEITATPVPGSQFPDTQLTGLAVDALTGGIYIGGYTGSTFDGAPNRGPRDIFVLRLDGDGNKLWASQYGTAGVLTFGAHMTADPNGGVYFAGSTDDPNERFSHSNAMIASYGPDGSQRWVKTLDGGWYDTGNSITVNSSGVYLVGTTDGAITLGHEITEWSQGLIDVLVARFSVTGNLVSIRLLGTVNGETGDGVVTAVNGDVYVAAGFGDQQTQIGKAVLARLHDAP